MKIDGYAVWDTEQKVWWKTRSGKTLWGRRVDAANAWNVKRFKLPLFSQQSRFKTVAVRMVPIEYLGEIPHE